MEAWRINNKAYYFIQIYTAAFRKLFPSKQAPFEVRVCTFSTLFIWLADPRTLRETRVLYHFARSELIIIQWVFYEWASIIDKEKKKRNR